MVENAKEEARTTGNFRFADAPDAAEILKCTHCGLCLNQCPTYRVLGWEMDSPRGRIRLMRGVTEGLFEVNESFAEHMDVCLACRACQTACPANINFGQMVEAARWQALSTLPKKPLPRLLHWAILKQLFPYPARLRGVASLLWFYQRSGLQSLARRLHLIPPPLRDSEALLPRLPDKFALTRGVVPAKGEKRGRVAFLTGCIMGTVFADTDAATLRVLTRNGFEVAIPQRQTCCGALAIHAGERMTAKEMARRNIDAFLSENAVAIIVNAAGCGLAMKEYGHLLADDPLFADKAREFSSKVKDATEFIVSQGIARPTQEIRARVTYQDPCHLAHGQGIRAEPRELLRLIPGLELVEMRDPDRCCGSAGIYNITHPDVANEVLAAKMDNVEAVKPEIVATANAGCLLQLELGVRQRGMNVEVLHVLDLLDRAYGGPDGYSDGQPRQRGGA